MAKKPPPGVKGNGIARSAVTGKFVSKKFAMKNPRTTVIEKRKPKK